MNLFFFLFLLPLSKAFFNHKKDHLYFNNNRSNHVLQNYQPDEGEKVDGSYYPDVRIYQPAKNKEKPLLLSLKLYPRLRLLIPNPDPNNNENPFSSITKNVALLLTTIPLIMILQFLFPES